MYYISHWAYMGKQNGHSSYLPVAYSLVGKTDINSLLTWITAMKEKYKILQECKIQSPVLFKSMLSNRISCDNGQVLYWAVQNSGLVCL